jgi:hypothetical protein
MLTLMLLDVQVATKVKLFKPWNLFELFGPDISRSKKRFSQLSKESVLNNKPKSKNYTNSIMP